MALAGVDVELRYGWREWVKTPTGWALAAHEPGAGTQGETTNSAIKSRVSPQFRYDIDTFMRFSRRDN